MNTHRLKAGFLSTGRVQATLIILALACFASAPASAQTTNWNGSAGDSAWSTSTNWDSGVPTGSTATNILNTTDNPVQLNSTAGVSTLTLGSGNSLDINGTAGLVVAGGSISNGGLINLTDTNSYLQLNADLTLSGTGTLAMAGGQIGTNGNTYTLTNQSTINGYGIIGSNNATFRHLSLNNSGTIDANSSGNVLSIQGDGGSNVNSGTMEATSGGILDLATNAAINNNVGLITAGTGSTVNVSTTIQGGSLSTTGTGVLQTSGAATQIGRA